MHRNLVFKDTGQGRLVLAWAGPGSPGRSKGLSDSRPEVQVLHMTEHSGHPAIAPFPSSDIPNVSLVHAPKCHQ